MAGGGERVWVNNTIIVGRDDRHRPLIIHAFRPTEGAPQYTPATGLSAQVQALHRTDSQRGGIKPLGRRELKALRLLAVGFSTAEIAAAMTISALTARNHVSTVMRKLGARNRVECLLMAAEQNLI
jgi:DNA-binding NarL/FixJ family response regulator